ncbi:MAG: hypothetical protein GWN00_24215 [Aliifodinibius sp.]|nr:hypothetical protein [Fodinibius sp.]NIY27793.1 hypothetical protein [Fodinibius sp.]
MLINKTTYSMWQKMTESMVPPGRIEFENSKFVLIFLPVANQVVDTSVGSVLDQ